MKKTVFKKIPVNPYSVELWLLITNDPFYEVTRLNFKNKGLEFKWEEDAAAMTSMQFYKNNYLLVVFDANQKQSINTICHEVIHIKNKVFEHAGIDHDPNNDEPETYLAGWIAEQIEMGWTEYKNSK